MVGLNRVMLIGHLGRDPEVRSFQNGSKVANMRLATSENWKDRQTGERQERTEWHSVAIFGPLADVAGSYLRKGSKVYIGGTLRTRKWQDQSGQDRYTTEVVVQGPGCEMIMLDSKDRDPGPTTPDAYGQAPPDNGGSFDDDIPF